MGEKANDVELDHAGQQILERYEQKGLGGGEVTQIARLVSNVGPFKDKEYNIELIGNNGYLINYAMQVLTPMMKYLDDAHIVYHSANTNACYVHGGFGGTDQDTYQKAFDTMKDLQTSTKLSEIKSTFTNDFRLDDFHQLGIGGVSPITGRLDLENFADEELVLQHMHRSARCTVVGHTPQGAGLPTIIRIRKDGSDRFLIQLDTQYSDRVNNSHCLAIDANGKFMLRGSWKAQGLTAGGSTYHDYVATCSDEWIGTIVTDVLGKKWCIVARVDDATSTYILVHYGEERHMETKVEIVDSRYQDPVSAPFQAYGTGCMELVCGDVESSVFFLHNFLLHAAKIMGIPVENQSSGKVAKQLKEKGCKIFSIGDVIGDPNGEAGGSAGVLGSDATCIKFMNEFADVKLCGNRDVNKLRFLHEIKEVMNSTVIRKLVELYLASLEDQKSIVDTRHKNAHMVKALLSPYAHPIGQHMKLIKAPSTELT